MLGTSFKNEARAHRIELLEPLRSLACVQCGHLAVLGWLVHDRRSEKKKNCAEHRTVKETDQALFFASLKIQGWRGSYRKAGLCPFLLEFRIPCLCRQLERNDACARHCWSLDVSPPPSLMHTHAMVASHHTHAKSSECALVRHVLPRASASLSLTPSLSLLGF